MLVAGEAAVEEPSEGAVLGAHDPPVAKIVGGVLVKVQLYFGIRVGEVLGAVFAQKLVGGNAGQVEIQRKYQRAVIQIECGGIVPGLRVTLRRELCKFFLEPVELVSVACRQSAVECVFRNFGDQFDELGARERCVIGDVAQTKGFESFDRSIRPVVQSDELLPQAVRYAVI